MARGGEQVCRRNKSPDSEQTNRSFLKNSCPSGSEKPDETLPDQGQ